MATPPTAIERLIGSQAAATVVLRHDLPDGSHHFDWMIATDAEARLPLMTFRLERPLHELAAGQSMRAEQIEDHRPEYLTYEGAVSGDRGNVTRVRSGDIRTATPGHEIAIAWNGDDNATPVHQVVRIREKELPFCEVFCVGKWG